MSSTPSVVAALRKFEGEIEQVYQAYASQVHYADDEEPLVAIVLHDITAQKAEEK